MIDWLEDCESWLSSRYESVLGVRIPDGTTRLRWLAADSLVHETSREDAQSVVIEDADIGWLIYILPFDADRIERQISEALGLRSRLLRESNYTGTQHASKKDDQYSSWRIGLVWLVDEAQWTHWQQKIIELRRESGAAEEISFDAVQVKGHDVQTALTLHGLPRLLLHTRALLRQPPDEIEKWLSVDTQVAVALQNFSSEFKTSRARTIAREVEDRAKAPRLSKSPQMSTTPRQFESLSIRNFRNLHNLRISADSADGAKVNAIVLFGPNGTGKSSFAEALCLAAFGTSPRFEDFLEDKDISKGSAESYVADYLTPITAPDTKPTYQWGGHTECEFSLRPEFDSKQRYDGIVLDQEASMEFTRYRRQQLAERVLRGYSSLADDLSAWLAGEERQANEQKAAFTRAHGLSSAIKRSSTAYNRLATVLLTEQLLRPSPEYLEWLRFLSKLSDDDGLDARVLAADWTRYQESVATNLPSMLGKLRERSESGSNILEEIRTKLNEYDELAIRSVSLRDRLEKRVKSLSEELDETLAQIRAWGTWLSSRSDRHGLPEQQSNDLSTRLQGLSTERSRLEREGKVLRARLELLDQTQKFLAAHWVKANPEICPVCESNVADRKGIEQVVSDLRQQMDTSMQKARIRYVEIQKRQHDLEQQIASLGAQTCPVSADDKERIRAWLAPFLPQDEALEEWLGNSHKRKALEEDLNRMKALPESPKPHASAGNEAARLTDAYLALTQEADQVLESPQSLTEVKRAFEDQLEKILINYLPSTLGRVWEELTLAMTAAPWLLPDRPKLEISQRGKALAIQVGNTGRLIRYVYNAAERHVLGLAWFFTFFLARRRFDEAWVVLDDPAQEMDQPSFRELARLWETMLRMHRMARKPFTLITALHQEERALDAARAMDGKLYIFGWQKEQQDTGSASSVKRVALLAPGYHPLKSASVFAETEA